MTELYFTELLAHTRVFAALTPGRELAPLVLRVAAGDLARQVALVGAVNAALGFSLMVMQESYPVSRLIAEQEKFLAITGISRTEFNKLATARKA